MKRRLIIISGAGLSADSGVRTFRTDTKSGKALWDEYDLAEVCDIGAFQAGYRRRTSPDVPVVGGVDEDGMDLYEKTNNFYNKRRIELATVEPNAAHLQIGQWFKDFPGQVLNLTTNVDDLLERAGVSRESVLHVHGYLPEIRYRLEVGSEEELVDVGYSHVDIDAFHWTKPNVVFFGEAAPLYTEMYALFDSLTVQDMVIVVGCSNQVINFNWDLFPVVRMGMKMLVVNPGLIWSEQEAYNEMGVLTYRAGAAETFSNKNFTNLIENHLKG